MTYNELASHITTDNQVYLIKFQDGGAETVTLFVHHDDFMGPVPCLTDNKVRDTKVYIPYPYYKLIKIASVAKLFLEN